jgi:cytochrome b pre-mRNA-processing protein 3
MHEQIALRAFGIGFLPRSALTGHGTGLAAGTRDLVATDGNNMVFQLFRRSANHALIDRLRGEIVAAARDPVLYMDYGIEDGLEGRFETLTLHAVLVLRRLNRMPPPAPQLAQDLTDSLFRFFDSGLRETGAGDAGLRKRMRTIAGAFLGRAAAYDKALNVGTPELAATLARNVYDGRGDPDRLARYVEAASRTLANASLEAFTTGPVPFPRPAAIP